MGFFKKRNKETASEAPASQEASPWDDMAAAANQQRAEQEQRKEMERQNSERQQRKIIAALLLGNGGVDPSPFMHHDVGVSEDMRDAYLDKVANNEIGDRQYRELLKGIGDPFLDAGNPSLQEKSERALSRVSSAYEHRILLLLPQMDRLSGGMLDMDHGTGSAKAQDIEAFYQKYPSPVDFERDSQSFLHEVGMKDRKDLQGYAAKMESLKKGLYGKKQEYWNQIKDLRDEATDYQLREQKRRERSGESGQY